MRQAVEACDGNRELRNFVAREQGGDVISDTPHFNDFSDGDKGFASPATHNARFARISQKIEQAPFDSLERLQAVLYSKDAKRSSALTPVVNGEIADTSMPQPSELGKGISKNAHLPPSGSNTSIKAPYSEGSGNKRSGSPTKQSLESFPFSHGSAAPVNNGQTSGARSRPASRLGPEEPSSERELTTAEKLQYQASQKRVSASGAKNATPAPSSSVPGPLYNFAAENVQDPNASAHSASANRIVPNKRDEDPLVAALAKLRSPSSAVDVLSPSSPGAPGGTATNSYGRSAGQVLQNRSQSPYLTGPPAVSATQGRRSPSQPIQADPRDTQYGRPPSSTGQYITPSSMPRSATSPGPMQRVPPQQSAISPPTSSYPGGSMAQSHLSDHQFGTAAKSVPIYHPYIDKSGNILAYIPWLSCTTWDTDRYSSSNAIIPTRSSWRRSTEHWTTFECWQTYKHGLRSSQSYKSYRAFSTPRERF